jgi:hypothetical protein
MQQAGASAQAAAAQPASTPPTFTQVCNYTTIFGPRAITIGATELCPLTLP